MTIAPQLRQSLEMLQKPVMELRQAIYHEMERNPLLEEVEDPSEKMESDDSHKADEQALTDEGQEYDPDVDAGEDPVELQQGQSVEEAENQDQSLDFNPDLDTVLREDDEMRDYALQGMENAPDLEDTEEKRQYMFDSIRQKESLQDHLLAQLTLTPLKGSDHDLAVTLIGNVNDDGYFTGSLPDLQMVSGKTEQEILAILGVIQTFDPPGVGARTLRECLLQQLATVEDSPWEDEARLLIDQYLDKLAHHDDAFLCKALKVDRMGLAKVCELVRSLNPRPGRIFTENDAEYVEPEVSVVRNDFGEYVAKVENELIPQIHISEHYRQLLENPDVPASTKSYVRERLRAGLFLIHSIEQRQETIRKIAQTIVDEQKDFWTQGVKALKPMTMVDVASKVGVHETTVSRTVANKYMRTPVGTFLMKFFFSTGLKGSEGEAVSNKSVRNLIEELVKGEDPTDPLSDQAIVAKLKEKGIACARRTVAKYRGILKIPPSHERRRT